MGATALDHGRLRQIAGQALGRAHRSTTCRRAVSSIDHHDQSESAGRGRSRCRDIGINRDGRPREGQEDADRELLLPCAGERARL